MTRWQYLTVDMSADNAGMTLDRLGAEGWEAVSGERVVLLKRPLSAVADVPGSSWDDDVEARPYVEQMTQGPGELR